jgi:amino acid adenylation domain-containing protein
VLAKARPFRRAVSPTERLYVAGERLAPPFAVQVFVEGHGVVDPRALEAAVAAASDACPGARLVWRGRAWADSGRPPPVRRVEAPQFDGHRFADAPWLRDRLDPVAGPTCEVLLVEGARTTLVFRAFHGVMDGQGVLMWARDVFRALRGEAPLGAPSTQTDVGLVRALGRTGRRPGPSFRHASPLGTPPGADHGFFWLRRTLPGRHPALVARLAALLARDGDRRFMVPVDLRRHAPDERSTANLSLPLFLDVRRGEPWEALHERLVTALAGRRELAVDGSEGSLSWLPLGAVGLLVRALLARQRRAGGWTASGILSHLGRVDAAECSAPGFAAESVFSLPVYGLLFPLAVVAVEGRAHVELTLAGPAADEARAAALLEEVAGALGGAETVRGPAAPLPPDETVASLFAAQAARTPHATAVVCGARAVTYDELRRRAAGVARLLRARGLGPGHVVGVVAERTPETMFALFGALEAGAAYLPLDPLHPPARLGDLLADAGAAVCLADARHADRLAPVFAGEVASPADVPAADPAPGDARPGDVAYVIYTSGSTGRPKGVQVEHRSLVNYVRWAQRAYDVDARTRFALFTSLAFDLSVTAYLVPLLAGGSVALVPEEVDPAVLRDVLERSGADALKLTPGLLEVICRLGARPAGFRTLVVGGEALRRDTVARAREVFGPACRVVNEYGPTEATVGCVFHVCDDDGDGATAPIGLPIDNTRIELVGEEVWIAGACLARGYLGRPDLDAERFGRLPDGERAYRTGDLARRRADGALEYLGRADEQLKIRGHRVEPGEVEAAIEAHPGVARAVVRGRARPGGQALCAWFVPRGEAPSAEALSDFCAARLPAAMVPSAWVAVPSVPLNANGKVDAAALPDPFPAAAALEAPARDGLEGAVAALEAPARDGLQGAVAATAAINAAARDGLQGAIAALEAPARDGLEGAVAATAAINAAARDGLEGAVAAIWREVLALPAEPPRDADFYHLGGDSLTLLQMLAAVSARVVGGGREAAFMERVRPHAARPTLAGVSEAARRAREAP